MVLTWYLPERSDWYSLLNVEIQLDIDLSMCKAFIL